MDTTVRLSVGRLEVDWGRNFGYADHSQLFQTGDFGEVPYYHAKGEVSFKEGQEEREFDVATEMGGGLSKPLVEVVDRMELLGYSMSYARREFEHVCRMTNVDTTKFNFEQLAEALAKLDVRSVSVDYGEGERYARFFRYVLFYKLGLQNLVDDPEYVRTVAGEGMENLSVFTVLHLVAQNPSARGLSVSWQLADVEEAGWGREESIVRPLDQENRFLIVTEGSTDAKILKHALSLLKPHLADFFDFVDMSEGYPFAGAGNLYRFTKGLISIGVRNNVVVLYDNDAEGVFEFGRTKELNLLDNMRVLKLPDLPEFQQFQTIGPSGQELADINGRGAAIECYLDTGPEAVVRWKNYKKQLDVYQGALVDKADVMKSFLAQKELSEDFDFSRITSVVSMLVSECAEMREKVRFAGLDAVELLAARHLDEF